jgi:hypothetical protein
LTNGRRYSSILVEIVEMEAEAMQKPAMVFTTMRIPQETWQRLRHLAEEKAMHDGGRPSVSGIVTDLVAQAKKAA